MSTNTLYYHNQKLENLPITLQTLDCRFNKITKLENLPNTLQILDCDLKQVNILH